MKLDIVYKKNNECSKSTKARGEDFIFESCS